MSNLSHIIRKFNRFELKYLVPIRAAEAFKQDVRACLSPDNPGDSAGAYGIASLYDDDAAERFTLLMWDTNESFGKLGMGSAGASFALDLSTGSTDQSGQMGGAGRRSLGGGSNALLSRFMAIDSFKSLYEEKLQEVYQAVFLSGAIPSQIDTYAGLIRAELAERDLVDAELYEAAVASTLEFVTQRAAYLETTSLLSGQ